jgi:hypothetical protein
MKGQSALEYLITYGWAILVILVVLAVLWYYGIFNPANWAQEQIKSGSAFNVALTDKSLNSSELSIKLSSLMAVSANVTRIEVLAGGDVTATAITPNELVAASGKSATEALTVTAAPASGSLAKFTVKVSYMPTGGVAGTDTLDFSIKVA